jgi:hypothetical protein
LIRFTCKGKFIKQMTFLYPKELILSLGLHRQEEPHCASVSFDKHAANMFQSYVQSALAFSIKRGGILYGNKDEEGNVTVHAIYEPPQVPKCFAALCFKAWAPFSKSTCFHQFASGFLSSSELHTV